VPAERHSIQAMVPEEVAKWRAGKEGFAKREAQLSPLKATEQRRRSWRSLRRLVENGRNAFRAVPLLLRVPNHAPPPSAAGDPASHITLQQKIERAAGHARTAPMICYTMRS